MNFYKKEVKFTHLLNCFIVECRKINSDICLKICDCFRLDLAIALLLIERKTPLISSITVTNNRNDPMPRAKEHATTKSAYAIIIDSMDAPST